jgi:predicted DNA-binding transcriptional regulator YafY
VIVDAAERLHVRAYDHTRGRFADFVLSRILECSPAGETVSFVSNRQDDVWHRYEKVAIRADPALAGERLMAVVRDFGLDEVGQRLLKVRAAVTRYLADEPRGFSSPVSVVMVGPATEETVQILAACRN